MSTNRNARRLSNMAPLRRDSSIVDPSDRSSTLVVKAQTTTNQSSSQAASSPRKPTRHKRNPRYEAPASAARSHHFATLRNGSPDRTDTQMQTNITAIEGQHNSTRFRSELGSPITVAHKPVIKTRRKVKKPTKRGGKQQSSARATVRPASRNQSIRE